MKRSTLTLLLSLAGLLITAGISSVKAADSKLNLSLLPDQSAIFINELPGSGDAFQVTRTDATGQFATDVTARIVLSGTAIEDVDYTVSRKSLHWAPGESQPIDIEINVINDRFCEETETIIIELVDVKGADVLNGRSEGTIDDIQDHINFITFGDANEDKVVNFADFIILSKNFGQDQFGGLGGDFNLSGTVDIEDFNILAANFGDSCLP